MGGGKLTDPLVRATGSVLPAHFTGNAAHDGRGPDSGTKGTPGC